jgi:hypothetical protein
MLTTQNSPLLFAHFVLFLWTGNPTNRERGSSAAAFAFLGALLDRMTSVPKANQTKSFKMNESANTVFCRVLSVFPAPQPF